MKEQPSSKELVFNNVEFRFDHDGDLEIEFPDRPPNGTYSLNPPPYCGRYLDNEKARKLLEYLQENLT